MHETSLIQTADKLWLALRKPPDGIGERSEHYHCKQQPTENGGKNVNPRKQAANRERPDNYHNILKTRRHKKEVAKSEPPKRTASKRKVLSTKTILKTHLCKKEVAKSEPPKRTVSKREALSTKTILKTRLHKEGVAKGEPPKRTVSRRKVFVFIKQS
ncbi:hypothetical protein BaRGS_00029513 [Batillaria attramentaria]|uniref:Uncharacterized protein n=1 Tax=Batillaria attramentaria TaxID=370345 RepID=A0ABD0JX97_9CAEN